MIDLTSSTAGIDLASSTSSSEQNCNLGKISEKESTSLNQSQALSFTTEHQAQTNDRLSFELEGFISNKELGNKSASEEEWAYRDEPEYDDYTAEAYDCDDISTYVTRKTPTKKQRLRIVSSSSSDSSDENDHIEAHHFKTPTIRNNTRRNIVRDKEDEEEEPESSFYRNQINRTLSQKQKLVSNGELSSMVSTKKNKQA